MSFLSRRFYQRLLSADQHDNDPTVPTDLLHRKNIALAMSYFSVGLTMSFMSTPLNIYLVEILDAEPQMQSTIYILQSLPWSLKIIFGFISDAFPIYGAHRKPYLTTGCILYSVAYIFYAVMGIPNVILLAGCIFLGTLGLIQLDVMADTMCVERSKFEPDDTKGQMQASCYSIRFAGSLLGAILGTTVSNQAEWGWGLSFMQVCFINGIIPFILVTPWLFSLQEKYYKKSEDQNSIELVEQRKKALQYSPHRRIQQLKNEDLESYKIRSAGVSNYSSVQDTIEAEKAISISNQLHEIWETVQLQAVWRPMAFVYIFNLFQIPNVAWQSFLQLSLHFEPWILGLTVTLGSFMTFAGILAYKYIFFKASWRNIYIWSVGLTTFFSLMQMCLIFQINKKYFHLNNYLFSLGDDVITAYISGIQFLPVCIMYTRLCPDGAEGSSYSMLTTFGNIALVCASNLGNLFANVWDVSNEAMREHKIDGLWRLTLLTSVLSMLPLTLLFLLPSSAAEQDELSKSKIRSKLGGIIFLTVLGLSLLWSISTAICRLISVWH